MSIENTFKVKNRDSEDLRKFKEFCTNLESFEESYDFVTCDTFSEEVKVLEQEGGGEGGSESCHTIFHFVPEDTYFCIKYSYYSHHGFDFDYCELSQVYPKIISKVLYTPNP